MQTADKGGKFWLSNMQTMDKDFAFLGPQICKIPDTAWREPPGAYAYLRIHGIRIHAHTRGAVHHPHPGDKISDVSTLLLHLSERKTICQQASSQVTDMTKI